MTWQEALSWTLIHFLWQGALIGLVTTAVMWALRRPESRYVAGCLGLVSMGAAAVGTFWYLCGAGTIPLVIAGVSEPTPLAVIFPWLNRAWAAGTTVLLLRTLGGWLVARRRTRAGLGRLSEEWQERAFRLTRRLGVEGRVRVFESVAVTVPMVFGWLRPVVLLPACALSGLTVGQVEALLAHELAHVRRHDYLVNLVQTALEAVLFYHPAVWWVSGRVRRERELCCDEVAVDVCGDRLMYSNALLRMEETRIAVVMAANGGSLKERIGRILGMSERKMGWTPAWVLGGIFVICMGVVWAKTEQAPPPPPPPPPPAERAPKVVKPSKPPKPAVLPDVPPPPPPPPARVGSAIPGGVFAVAVDSGPAEAKWTQEQLQHAQQAMMSADLERQRAEVERAIQKIREQRDVTEEQRAKLTQELDRVRQRLLMESQRMSARAWLPAESEIERRMKYVEERFSKDGVNGLLTDRGRAYLKMGPPDEIESHPGQGDQWLYRDGNRIVKFDESGKLKK